jgi:hypothetical protein
MTMIEQKHPKILKLPQIKNVVSPKHLMIFGRKIWTLFHEYLSGEDSKETKENCIVI